MDWIFEPWPWYVAGPLIALVMISMHYIGNGMGISTNFKTLCSLTGAGKVCSFFDWEWKNQKWNLLFILGVAIGGFLSVTFLEKGDLVLSESFKETLSGWNINSETGKFFPEELFSFENLINGNGWIFLILGPFLVGFGSRYGQGCTSGHAISGLSNLQFRSLVAVIGFFVGGMIITYLLFPNIL
jgi:uncharacterized membrane protein YedE/YeeE